MVYGSDGSGRCDPDPLLVAKVYLVTARTSRLPTKGAVFFLASSRQGPPKTIHRPPMDGMGAFGNAAYKKIPEPIKAIGVRDGVRSLAGWDRAG